MKNKMSKTKAQACPAKAPQRTALAQACPAKVSQRTALVIAGSHRKGGNSDHAAGLMAQEVQNAGHNAEIVYVRDYPVLPCLGCGHCAKSKGHTCVLAEKDQAEELFAKILEADTLFIASPIYFYHLPSMFKAIVDRSQRFWEASLKGNPLGISPKSCGIAMVAARDKGDNLFTGSLLTLKYFLTPLNIAIISNENFYGVDQPGDFKNQDSYPARLASMVQAVLMAE